jgi:mannose-1-phosphate guanylyltransferase
VGYHVSVGADVTLHLVEVPDARAYGCVPSDVEGRVTAFLEKMDDPVTRWVNAGCYVFRRSVVDAIPAGQVVSVERETFPGLLAAGRDVRAWKESAYWIDVGTPEALVRCSADVVLGVAPTAAEMQPPAQAWFAEAERPADALVDGGSSIGPGAHIGAAAHVSGSIVMAGAVVGEGAVLRDSVVGVDARVGAGARLDRVVLADGAEVPAGTEPAVGARVTG